MRLGVTEKTKRRSIVGERSGGRVWDCTMCAVVRRCVKKLYGKGGQLRLGNGSQVSGETEEPVNLMEIKGIVVTRGGCKRRGSAIERGLC